MPKKKAALFYDYPLSDGEVFGQGRRARIAALTELYPEVVNAGNFERHAPRLGELEVIFATWGLPNLSDQQLARLPKLEAVFYAAGNVKAFAQQLVDHDLILVSAWAVNAIPVAEMCLAQILLSLRGYFRSVRAYRERKTPDAKAFWRPGVFGATIGLIGIGKIGTRLRELLRAYPLTVIAHDPFLTEARAAALEVERVGLPELFRRADIVSNHIPDLPSTRGTLARRAVSRHARGGHLHQHRPRRAGGRGRSRRGARGEARSDRTPGCHLAGAAGRRFQALVAAQRRHQPAHRRHHRR